jgi:DNA-binding MarR family transcriptional regulator
MMRATEAVGFDLDQFLPYLLNQAAEASSHSFAATYRREYGMTRTQWRVMANLGKFGAMSATEICRRAHIDKTKVSRAVSQLEAVGFLTREKVAEDKRRERLALTDAGCAVYARLGAEALAFQAALAQGLGPDRLAALEAALRAVIALHRDIEAAPE